jgi:hypothetical protein
MTEVVINCFSCHKRVVLSERTKHTCGSSVFICDTGGVVVIGNAQDSSLILATEVSGD